MIRLLLFGLVAVAGAVSVNAGSIGLICGSCFGGTHTLDASALGDLDGKALTDQHRFTYALDTQGVTEPAF